MKRLTPDHERSLHRRRCLRHRGPTVRERLAFVLSATPALAAALFAIGALVALAGACNRKEAPPQDDHRRAAVQTRPLLPSAALAPPAAASATTAAVVALTPGFVRVPAGRFVMGSPLQDPERQLDETPHRVTLTRAFEMQATEVTQAEYRALTGRAPAAHEGCDECPVEQVSWFDAVEWCNRLSARRGLPDCYTGVAPSIAAVGPHCAGFRLPSEAEWEYAARAGSTAARYGDVDAVAWHDLDSEMRSHPVASLKANAWGLYDMLGNVFEWTNDWQADYPDGADVDPSGPRNGENRVFRGGGYRLPAAEARAAFRNGYGPDNRVEFIGFRCIRTLPVPAASGGSGGSG